MVGLAWMALTLLFGCTSASYSEVPSEMSWVAINEAVWADESSMTVTSSGLSYHLLERSGEGAPVSRGQAVKVLYKLYLKDGHKHIYSQSNVREAFSMKAGGGGVIKGFDEAISLMHIGDRGRFLMPADIAYGKSGASGFGIPGGATLEYYLELRDANGRLPNGDL